MRSKNPNASIDSSAIGSADDVDDKAFGDLEYNMNDENNPSMGKLKMKDIKHLADDPDQVID